MKKMKTLKKKIMRKLIRIKMLIRNTINDKNKVFNYLLSSEVWKIKKSSLQGGQ